MLRVVFENDVIAMIGMLIQAVFVVAYIVHFVLIIVNFSKKLKQFADVLCDNNTKKQACLYNLLNKLYVCWLFAIISTFLSYILISVCNIVFGSTNAGKSNDEGQEVEERNRIIMVTSVYILSNIDSFINLIALTMQFDFADSIYGKLCKIKLRCTPKRVLNAKDTIQV